MKKYINGFTLIELMIVVSIIAFLVLLATIYLRTQVFKGYDARRKADLKRIGIAVEEYEKDNDCYPPPDLVTCNGGGVGLQPYLNNIPCDPVSKTSYAYTTDTSACSKWYILFADLDNESDSDYSPNIGPSSAYSFYYASPNAPAVVSSESQVGGTGFYGCFSGQCREISVGTLCTPQWQAIGCYDQCGFAYNECN